MRDDGTTADANFSQNVTQMRSDPGMFCLEFECTPLGAAVTLCCESQKNIVF